MSKKKVDEPISRERQLVIDDYEKNYWKNMGKAALKDWRLYLMFLPLFLLFLFWRYFPMYDLMAAFKLYDTQGGTKTVSEMDFTGLYYFKQLLAGDQASQFWPAFRNTFMLSFYGLLFGFPMPVLLALFFSEIKSNGVRSILQIASYLPKFVSLVVITSIIHLVLKNGVVDKAGEIVSQPGVLARGLVAIGFISQESAIDGLMYSPGAFRSIYEVSAIWSEAGYGSIVYFAAIIGISPTSYEAARIDGASKMAQIKYVVLPGILSTVVIMLIMKLGHLMSIGYEKVLLLQTKANEATSEIVSTYVFKVGGLAGASDLGPAGTSIGSAADMLNAIISMLLVIGANTISKHAADTSLF